MTNEEKKFDFENQPGLTLKNYDKEYKYAPKISIITAYYNASKYFNQTLNCVLNQTFPYWEWIIVNDGSTDKQEKEYLNQIAKQDKRIKVFHKDNEGLPKTRDYAIDKASCEILYILDADDLLDPTLFECGYWSLQTNPEATWCYSNHVAFQDLKYLWNQPFNLRREKKENIVCGSCFVKKSKIKELGGYAKAENNVYEDWHLWLRFLAKGYYPIRMSFYGFWYRRQDGVLKHINKKKKRKKYAMSIIKELSKQIENKVDAVQFPISYNFDYKMTPYEFDWDLPVAKTKKKKLLFILPWLVIGGADTFNFNLISKLDKDKYDITIVTTECELYVQRQMFEKHATVFDLTTFLHQKDWATFIHYLIKTRNMDLVFMSNSYYGYYVMPWLKAKCPTIPFVDYLHAQDFSWRNGGYPRDSIAISNLIDRSYTATNYLKNLMCTDMNRKKENIETVYIGVDEKKYNPESDDININDIIKGYENKKIILFSCRIVELKRPILVLEILKKLIEKHDDVVLFVVGDGEELPEMIYESKRMGIEKYIKFWRMKNDLRPFYKVAHVTIIPSLTEGLSAVAYESLSMGVPVVSSDVGGQKEMIDDKTGKIIKTYQTVEEGLFNRHYNIEEIKEYVNAIEKIIYSKKYNDMSKNCREKILKNFTIDKMINALDASFSQLINSKSKIDVKLSNNLELSSNYLMQFLQNNKLYVNPDLNGSKWTIKDRIIDFLWRFSIWRGFIFFCKKIGFIKLKKQLFSKHK